MYRIVWRSALPGILVLLVGTAAFGQQVFEGERKESIGLGWNS